MQQLWEQLVNKFSLFEHCTRTPQLVKPSTLDPYNVVVINLPLAISLVRPIYSSLCLVVHDASEGESDYEVQGGLAQIAREIPSNILILLRAFIQHMKFKILHPSSVTHGCNCLQISTLVWFISHQLKVQGCISQVSPYQWRTPPPPPPGQAQSRRRRREA